MSNFRLITSSPNWLKQGGVWDSVNKDFCIVLSPSSGKYSVCLFSLIKSGKNAGKAGQLLWKSSGLNAHSLLKWAKKIAKKYSNETA